jgi:hypothetical protein
LSRTSTLERPVPLRFRLLRFATGAAALYGAALLAVSLTSDEIVLPPGYPKRFCGFYLDCHRMVEVAGVETRERLTAGADTLAARGRFHVVTLRLHSDAVRATLRIGPLSATVRDARGRTYARDAAAERLLAPPAGLPDTALPAGGELTTRVVFDLPRDADDLRLFVRDAHLVSRLTELVLIGDEDSFLHRRTVFALSGRGGAGRSSGGRP